jgi:HEAT repeat protein
MNSWGEPSGKPGAGETGEVMKSILLSVTIILSLLAPPLGITAERQEHMARCLELLSKGKDDEKHFALDWLSGYLWNPENRKDGKALGLILKTLRDKNPSLREAAAFSLGKLGKHASGGGLRETEIVPSLIGALDDKIPAVRREAAKALAPYKDKRSLDPLIERLGDPDPWVRLEAVHALHELREQKAVLPLLQLLHDDSDFRYKFVQQGCLRAIGWIGFPHTTNLGTRIKELGRLEEDLVRSLITPVFIRKFEDDYLKEDACRAIGRLRMHEGRDLLFKAMKSEQVGTRSAALESLVQLSLADYVSGPGRIRAVKADEAMFTLLASSSKDPSAEVRAIAVDALGKSGDDRAVDPLIGLLEDQDKPIREKAIEGLERFREEKILGAVIPFIDSNAGENTFLSIAEKTAQGFVYFRVVDGRRYLFQDRAESPEIIGRRRLMIHPLAMDKLLHAIGTKKGNVRIFAVRLMSKFQDERIEPHLLQLLNDKTPGVRRAAVAGLGDFPSDSNCRLLIQALQDGDHEVRKEAAKVLGDLQVKEAFPFLIRALDDHAVAPAAVKSLARFKDKSGIPVAARIAWRDRNRVYEVTQALESFERSELLIELTGCLVQTDAEIKKGALLLLKDFGDQSVLEAIENVSKDPDPEMAEVAKKAIIEIRSGRNRAMLMAPGSGHALRPPPITLRTTSRKEKMIGVGSASDLPKELLGMSTDMLARKLGNQDPGMRRLSVELLAQRGGGPEIVGYLIPLLKDPHEGVREEVARELGRLKAKETVGPIVEALDDSNTDVRLALIWALGELRDPEAVERLVPFFSDKDERIRSSCFDAFQKLEDSNTRIALFDAACKHGDEKVRTEAAERLGYLGDSRALPLLIALLEDKSKPVRLAASWGLGNLQAKEAVTPITERLHDPDVDVRVALIQALGSINDARAVGTLSSLIRGKESRVSGTAVEALVRIQSREAEGALLDALKGDREYKIRVKIEDALGEKGDRRFGPHLVPLLEDKNEYVRQASARALGTMKVREAFAPLIESLKDIDSNVLAWSIWALGEINDQRSLDPLTPFLFVKEQKLRERCLEAFLKFRDPESRKLLVLRLFESAKKSSWPAGGMLSKVKYREGEGAILKAFEDPGKDETKTVRNYVDLIETNVLMMSDLATKALENYRDKDLVIRELDAAPYTQRRDLLKNRLLSSTAQQD